MAKRDLAIDLFRSFKTGIIKKRKVVEVRNNTTTDPQLLGDVLTNLIEERDWKAGVAEGTLFTQWATIVGADIAQHASPVSINENVLTIQTTSTAWATQLSLVQNEVLKQFKIIHLVQPSNLFQSSAQKPHHGSEASDPPAMLEVHAIPTIKG